MKKKARTIRWGGTQQSPADLRSHTCPRVLLWNLNSALSVTNITTHHFFQFALALNLSLILLFSFENNFSEGHFKSMLIDFIFIILPDSVSFDRKIYVLRIYWDSWDGIFDFFFHLLLYVSSVYVWLLWLPYLYCFSMVKLYSHLTPHPHFPFNLEIGLIWVFKK